MQISNLSVASLFQEMQSLAGGGPTAAGFGSSLTGQNLPTQGATAAGPTSLAASPLSLTPANQFASNVLSALLSTQEAPPSPQTLAANIISTLNPGGDGTLSLPQVEQALTGSSASSSPQQLSIANAFDALTAGGGALTQDELAAALQSLQTSDSQPLFGGHRHHHHHHIETASADASPGASAASTASTTSAASTSELDSGAGVSTPATSTGPPNPASGG